jgi:hypothetical protein
VTTKQALGHSHTQGESLESGYLINLHLETVLEYQPSKTISLKSSPTYSEKWLQAKIVEDPTILGLGDLEVRDVERRQHKAGRLDLLLADIETNTRYEVEIQLGGTDESHIIRTIEYWDLERRRYPMYDHVAVIVAEDITSRFLNVVGLFNGFIPLIAIQLRAIQVGGVMTLSATTVLDRTSMVDFDEEDLGITETYDRVHWEKRGSNLTVGMADELLALIQNLTGDKDLRLKYNKYYIGLARDGIADNFISFAPRKQHIQVEFKIPRSDELSARVQDLGMETLSYDTNFRRFRVKLNPGDIVKHREMLAELIGMAIDLEPTLGDSES